MMKGDMGISKICDLAICALEHVEKGEEFIVQDLYPELIWKHLEPIRKAEIGRKFWDYVKSDKGKDLAKPLDKTDLNQQRYVRL